MLIWHSNHVQVLKIDKNKEMLTNRGKIVSPSGWNGLNCVNRFQET